MEKLRNDYPYKALNAARQEIRLLVLLPAASSCRIACRLFHRSLNEPPIHDALSYRWSDPTVTETIRLNSHAFQVPSRLETTLRDLRLPDRPRILWIDAICIDQRNTAERGQQVQLMRLVYEKAVTVRAWLDLEIDGTDPAFARLALLDQNSSVQDLGDNPEFWKPVLPLFRQPYWSRVWIQQELTCTVDFTIHCRSNCVSGLGFLRFKALLMAKPLADKAKWDAKWKWITPFLKDLPKFGGKDLLNLRATWKAKSAVSAFFQLSEFHSHLLDLLDQARRWQCTDPKDRVYGLMNLAMDYEPEAISVNYDLSVAEVFCSVAKYLVVKRKSLAFLDQVTPRSITSEHKLPTWVPDWDDDRQLSTILEKRKSSNQRFSPACGQVVGRPPVISPCGKILQVQGFHVDSIMAVCQESFNEVVSNLPISVAFQRWMEVVCAEQRTSRSVSRWGDITQAQQSALMRTLIAGNELDQMESVFDEIFDFVNDPVKGDMTLYSFILKLTEKSASFLLGMILTNQDRLLFKSGKGAVGLLPNNWQPTDEVWILFRCATPIVLRPSPEGDIYSVVGMAYVDGIMKGEAVQDVPNEVEEGYRFGEDYEVRTINLC